VNTRSDPRRDGFKVVTGSITRFSTIIYEINRKMRENCNLS
jgi:hypothetical protein